MTTEEILALAAGRQTDRLVARLVMGWPSIQPYNGPWPWPPHFSTDMEAAWGVARHFIFAPGPHGKNWGFHLSSSADNWRCQLCPGCVCHTAEATADTGPLAVCRTALLAVRQAAPAPRVPSTNA